MLSSEKYYLNSGKLVNITEERVSPKLEQWRKRKNKKSVAVSNAHLDSLKR